MFETYQVLSVGWETKDVVICPTVLHPPDGSFLESSALLRVGGRDGGGWRERIGAPVDVASFGWR